MRVSRKFENGPEISNMLNIMITNAGLCIVRTSAKLIGTAKGSFRKTTFWNRHLWTLDTCQILNDTSGWFFLRQMYTCVCIHIWCIYRWKITNSVKLIELKIYWLQKKKKELIQIFLRWEWIRLKQDFLAAADSPLGLCHMQWHIKCGWLRLLCYWLSAKHLWQS